MNIRTTTAPAVSTSADTILRGLGAARAIAVAQIHFLDVFGKFDENAAQLVGYIISRTAGSPARPITSAIGQNR